MEGLRWMTSLILRRMHQRMRAIEDKMYAESDHQDMYEEGDDDASETNQSVVSSTVSNASTSRLSTASTQRDEYEVRSRLSSSLAEAEELSAYNSRLSPVAARQRLEDLVNRLVLHGDVLIAGGREELEEEDESERDSDSEYEERRPPKRKRSSKEPKEKRTRTFVVGMRNGEVITETFPEGEVGDR